MIALCLLTCGREDYTKRTLVSFDALNDMERFTKLHFDDSSAGARNDELAARFCFQSLPKRNARLGVSVATLLLVQEAFLRGIPWTLVLQNDWESVKPFPWHLLQRIHDDDSIWALRLWGRYKDQGDPIKDEVHKGKRSTPVEWEPYADGAEIASIHYGAPPTAYRTEMLLRLLAGSSHEREAMRNSGAIDAMTVRVTDNVVYHIGEDKTPGFIL